MGQKQTFKEGERIKSHKNKFRKNTFALKSYLDVQISPGKHPLLSSVHEPKTYNWQQALNFGPM